jgi:hypothetical protein
MQRCPPEIWSEILGHLDVDNNDGHNLATIKACTLLFKSLVPIAQAEVFRNINISHPRHGERLLDILNQKPSLVHRIGRVDIHDGSDLWAWLSSSRALDLLAHLSHAPSLTISADYKAVPEVQTLRKIMSQLVAIKHLEVALFPFRHFLEVCILLSCFQSTLKSLKLGCSVEPPSDYHVDIDDTPYFLAAEALWEHTSPLVFPCLTSITFNWFHCEELADWFVHSGVADQIQAPNIVSDDFYHVDHARSFLSSGCKALRRLSLGMCEDAWELVSGQLMHSEPALLRIIMYNRQLEKMNQLSCPLTLRGWTLTILAAILANQ